MQTRIEFLTQDDAIYLLPFFDEFLRHYSKEFEIAQISLCRAMGKRSRIQLASELLALYGIAGLVRLLGQSAKAKILGFFPKPPDSPHYYTLRQLCRAYGVESAFIQNPNSDEFVASVQARNCNLLISVACPYILKEKLLGVPSQGCVNIHHAPLPRYKGMMPTFWQLYHGEKTVGLTIHYMDAKLDEGEALYQTELEVTAGESLHQVICRSKRHAAHCLAQVLGIIETQEIKPKKLDQTAGTKFTFPTREEIREFHRRGFRAI
jgi:methionyl-tRNA formyltransferase